VGLVCRALRFGSGHKIAARLALCCAGDPHPEPSGDGSSRVAGKALLSGVRLSSIPSSYGVTDIPRKPNYDFERREREKTKASESAKKAQAKADKKAAAEGMPDEAPDRGSGS
jgi:hypothetical protein